MIVAEFYPSCNAEPPNCPGHLNGPYMGTKFANMNAIYQQFWVPKVFYQITMTHKQAPYVPAENLGATTQYMAS